MEKVLDSYQRLQDSESFKDWKKNNSESYLTHAFTMYEKNQNNEWQFGYYCKSIDKITTFVMEDEIKIMPPAEVLKRDDLLNELDIKKVDIDLQSALNKSNTIQKENYKGQDPMKIIVLLQNLKEGFVWNLTYLTVTFKTLNIKISAISGDVLEHNLHDLIRPDNG